MQEDQGRTPVTLQQKICNYVTKGRGSPSPKGILFLLGQQWLRVLTGPRGNTLVSNSELSSVDFISALQSLWAFQISACIHLCLSRFLPT